MGEGEEVHVASLAQREGKDKSPIGALEKALAQELAAGAQALNSTNNVLDELSGLAGDELVGASDGRAPMRNAEDTSGSTGFGQAADALLEELADEDRRAAEAVAPAAGEPVVAAGEEAVSSPRTAEPRSKPMVPPSMQPIPTSEKRTPSMAPVPDVGDISAADPISTQSDSADEPTPVSVPRATSGGSLPSDSFEVASLASPPTDVMPKQTTIPAVIPPAVTSTPGMQPVAPTAAKPTPSMAPVPEVSTPTDTDASASLPAAPAPSADDHKPTANVLAGDSAPAAPALSAGDSLGTPAPAADPVASGAVGGDVNGAARSADPAPADPNAQGTSADAATTIDDAALQPGAPTDADPSDHSAGDSDEADNNTGETTGSGTGIPGANEQRAGKSTAADQSNDLREPAWRPLPATAAEKRRRSYRGRRAVYQHTGGGQHHSRGNHASPRRGHADGR